MEVSRSRVGLPIYLLQAIRGDVGVNLGGGKRGMAQQFLHGPQICAAFEQVRRKTVTQDMRRDLLQNACLLAVFGDQALDGPGGQRLA